MTFEQAQQQYTQLRGQLQAGALTQAQFAAAAAALRVQSPDGRWWQVDPSSGQWLYWDGAAWKPASPPSALLAPSVGPASGQDGRTPADHGHPARTPAAVQPQAQRQPQLQVAAAPVPGAPQQGGPVGQHLQPGQGNLSAFVAEAKQKPLAQRSQVWWDMLAVLGGLISGYLWFVYSGVRGFPTPNFMGSGWGRTLFNFVPASGLLLIPILMFVFRKPLGKFMTSIPPLVRNLLFALPALLMCCLGLLSYAACALFPNSFQKGEGVDIVTPLMVMVIPLLLVWFRRPTDAVLRPFQPIRQAIPKGILIGAGLLTPFAVAFFLYYGGKFVPGRVGDYALCDLFKEYSFLRISVFVGTLISYVILRTPAAPLVGSGRAAVGLAGQAIRAVPTILWMAGLGILFYQSSGWADDFLRDPFNLNDGLRTDMLGIAPIIAGTATSIVTVLVNGAEVVRVVIVDPNPPPPGQEGPGQQSNFQVVVDTVGTNGARSTELVQGVNETVYVYAHCTKEGARFPQGDPTISFTPNFDQTFVSLTDMGTQNGRRCASVALVLPTPAGTPPKTVTVLVGAGQAVQGVPVTLTVQVSDYVLELR